MQTLASVALALTARAHGTSAARPLAASVAEHFRAPLQALLEEVDASPAYRRKFVSWRSGGPYRTEMRSRPELTLVLERTLRLCAELRMPLAWMRTHQQHLQVTSQDSLTSH